MRPSARSSKYLFRHRLATLNDCGQIHVLIDCSISALLRHVLTPEQVVASRGIMGLDTQLIRDGTYFVVEVGKRIVGCGGWSRRAKQFGGDHFSGAGVPSLDPAVDAVRIRAMYTHPEFARCGIGRTVLSASEAAAVQTGFNRAELVATLGGEPFYLACGYGVLERFEQMTPSAIHVPVVRMQKKLT